MSRRSVGAGIVVSGDVRSSVASSPIIPNCNIIRLPAIPDLEVVIVRVMPSQVFQEMVGFVLREFVDPLGEAGIRVVRTCFSGTNLSAGLTLC